MDEAPRGQEQCPPAKAGRQSPDRTAFPQPGEHVVEILDGEHDAQVAERVHRRAAMVGDDRRREEAGQLEPVVAVRRAHHRDLDALLVQPGDAIGPVALDRGAPLELETELAEERDGGVEVRHHDADVVHSRDGHLPPWLVSTSIVGGVALAISLNRRRA
jgi:hypothetical protein